MKYLKLFEDVEFSDLTGLKLSQVSDRIHNTEDIKSNVEDILLDLIDDRFSIRCEFFQDNFPHNGLYEDHFAINITHTDTDGCLTVFKIDEKMINIIHQIDSYMEFNGFEIEERYPIYNFNNIKRCSNDFSNLVEFNHGYIKILALRYKPI